MTNLRKYNSTPGRGDVFSIKILSWGQEIGEIIKPQGGSLIIKNRKVEIIVAMCDNGIIIDGYGKTTMQKKNGHIKYYIKSD